MNELTRQSNEPNVLKARLKYILRFLFSTEVLKGVRLIDVAGRQKDLESLSSFYNAPPLFLLGRGEIM